MTNARYQNWLNTILLALAITSAGAIAIANTVANPGCHTIVDSQTAFRAQQSLAVVVVEPQTIHVLALKKLNDKHEELIGADLPDANESHNFRPNIASQLKIALSNLAAKSIPLENVFFYSTSECRSTPDCQDVLVALNRALDVDIHPISLNKQTLFSSEPNGLTYQLLMHSSAMADKFSQHADMLAHKYREDLPLAVRHMEKILTPNSDNDEFHAKFESRAKSPSGIDAKLKRRAFNENLDLPDLENLKRHIGDGIGLRLVLKDPNMMNGIISRVISSLSDGTALITKIRDYHDKNLPSYITPEQADELKRAADQAARLAVERTAGKINVRVDDKEKGQPSGYTSLNLKFLIFPDGLVNSDGHANVGIPVELQIRGLKIDELAKIEHIYYDVLRLKYVDVVNNPKLQQFVEALKDLNHGQKEELRNYLSEWYAYARTLELNDPDQPLFSDPNREPSLPPTFPHREVLSIENAVAAQRVSNQNF